MKKQHTSMFSDNPFTKAFQQFDEETFFNNLHNQVKNKSYFEQYQGFKDTILTLSYLFNLASMLTASYAVFWLTKWLTGFVILGYIVAAIFLFFLEKLKRKSSNEFFQVYFFRKQIAAGWLALSLACLGISLVSSAFGTKTSTEELAPNPELITADSTAQAYQQTVAKLEQENQKLSTQTNHEGTIYYKLQNVIDKNTVMIADYNTRILELDKKMEGKNELLNVNYRKQVNVTSWTLVWITILLELLFELCIAYIWYYYYRSYVEKTGVSSTLSAVPTANNKSKAPYFNDALDLKKDLQTIQQQLHSLQKKQTLPIQEPLLNSDSPRDEKNISNQFSHKPIGFYSDRQLALMKITPTLKDESNLQVCTDVYTPDSSDLYTIEHQYKKGNKIITVHYTLAQVDARIAQYSRGVETAKSQNLNQSVVENRVSWLAYWQKRRKELLGKIELNKK